MFSRLPDFPPGGARYTLTNMLLIPPESGAAGPNDKSKRQRKERSKPTRVEADPAAAFLEAMKLPAIQVAPIARARARTAPGSREFHQALQGVRTGLQICGEQSTVAADVIKSASLRVAPPP